MNKYSVKIFTLLFFTFCTVISSAQVAKNEIKLIKKSTKNNSSFGFNRAQEIRVSSTIWNNTEPKNRLLLKRIFPKVYDFLETYAALEIYVETKGIKKGNKLSENVLSSKITGLKSPKILSLIFQSDYSDLNYRILKISGRRFYNPIYYPKKYHIERNEKGGLISYHFKPKRENRFLLDGYFYINENQQIDFFTAKPSKKIKGLNNELSIENLVTDSMINPKVISSNALVNSKSRRLGSVDVESKTTFTKYYQTSKKLRSNNIILDFDSIQADSNNSEIDKTLDYLEALKFGRLGIGKIDILLKHLVSYNGFEGLRLGFGVSTNQKLSKLFDVGGYFAFGSLDNRFKYGVFSNLYLHKKSNTKIFTSYVNDLIEPGNTYFPYGKRIFYNEGFRKFGILYFDKTERLDFKFKTTLLKNIFLESGFSSQQKSSLYDYYFIDDNNRNQHQINTNELNIGVRYNPDEKFFKQKNRLYSLGSKYPSLIINYIKSINLNNNPFYDYHRFDIKVEKNLNLMQYGNVDFQLISGLINNNNIPYPVSYNLQGSYRSGTPIIHNTFGTMGYNEFMATKYLALFYLHNVGKIAHQKTFKPELLLIHNMGIGNSVKLSKHNININSMENGYFESGFYFKNLISFQHLVGQTGFGMGFLYRYGNYTRPDVMDNLVFKFSLDFDI